MNLDKPFSRALACGVLVGMGLLSRSAIADDAQKLAQEGVLQEVVVTAERRTESIQTTPVAVSAFSGEQMARQGQLDIRDLVSQVPDMTMGGDQEVGITPVIIRGVGTTDPEGPTQDNPVAFYVDDVYLSRPYSDIFMLPDVSRVEVLAGPQGVLFGRNASGGAVRVITLQPESTFHAAANVSYGSFNEASADGYVLMPAEDHLSVKVAAGVDNRDGWAFNSAKDQHFGGEHNSTFAGEIRYFTEADNLRLSVRDSSASFRSQFVNTLFFPNQPININTTTEPHQETKQTSGVSLTETHHFANFADLNVILAHVNDGDIEDFDSDTSVLDLVSIYGVSQSGYQNSAEFRLTSNTQGPFQWLGGVYLYYEHAAITGDVLGDSGFTGIPPGQPGYQVLIESFNNIAKTKSAAVYLNASYKILPTLELSAGARGTYDQKYFLARTGGLAAPPAADQPTVNATRDWRDLSPQFILKYTPNAQIMAYASVSKGFRSGTWAITGSDPDPAKPEVVWNYEVGQKATLFDSHLFLDVDVFYERYQNKQEEIVVAPGVTSDRNAASAQNRGVELNFKARVLRHVSLSGDASYQHAVYGQYIGNPADIGPEGVALGLSDVYTGHELPYAPRWKGGLVAGYTVSAGADGDITLQGSWTYQGRTYFTRTNYAGESSAPYNDFGLSLLWDANDHLTASAFVNNLTDERHPVGVMDFINQGLGIPTTYNLPRMMGLRFDYKY